ncbi:uncharacterized protein F4807DRAFT_60135 [Annulohypoxylon truncatum]|uniref:uncharacterized protein n=1 Tax=Annulohypoxylon truncatum TaxID=327061 RepID=UPI00200785E1|nr:uncharacterized protein F4807DRAFT_60135 [Annulohypoxylon truncatum]KAI1210309.1 hypothetical protein F4807DRAFT_60135 [Annulohypoxylon truncatum]
MSLGVLLLFVRGLVQGRRISRLTSLALFELIRLNYPFPIFQWSLYGGVVWLFRYRRSSIDDLLSLTSLLSPLTQ